MVYKVLDELLYSKTHEWIRIIDDEGIVGITDYAQQKLGDVVFVELPSKGDKVKKDEKVCEIESVKTVAEVYTPVSGEIIDVNEKLLDSPELINTSPYEQGWIFKIRISNKDELNELLGSKDYMELIKHED